MNKLKLGVAREIITPKVGGHLYGYNDNIYSTCVADELTATALCFEYGSKKALLISITVCEISTALCDKIRELIGKETGIPAEYCLLCATHTHSGPNVAGTEGWGNIDTEYCDSIFIPSLINAAKKAAKDTKHVRAGISFGESFVGVNRRETKPCGKIDLGQDKDGPFNPRMTVISFKDDDGKIIANLIHYGAHGTAAGMNTEITRDWPGVMTDALEKHSSGISAFINGTMGDAGPRLKNGKTTGDLSHVYELGNIAAKDAVRIFDGIAQYTEADFSIIESQIKIPLKEKIPLEQAEKMFEELSTQTENIGGLKRAYAKSVIELYKNGSDDKQSFDFSQTVLRIADVIFAGFPFELFCNTGKNIDNSLSDASVLCLSNVNGFEGYFAAGDEILRGGYEIEVYLYSRPQQFCDNADKVLEKKTLDNIIKAIKATEE